MSDVQPTGPRPKRVRKFDRPSPPHDWRWWVGGVGKTLIATGLLLFGFVAYQLWGTGIETARAQNALGNEFEALLAAAPPTSPAPAPTTPPSSTTVTDGAPEASTPVSVPDTTTTVPAPAPPPSLPPISEGDPIARIEIPRLGVGKWVVAGVEKSDLKNGPGHYPETPLPGQLGNAAIAGHRTTFGQPFFDIDKLDNGDEIILTTLTGRFVYRVTGQQIVSPSDYQVIATTDPTKATLTLTTCHPKYTARQRLIVSAELDVEASSPVGESMINYGRPIDTAATDDPDQSNVVAAPATTEDPDTDSAVTVPTDQPAIGGSPATTIDGEQIDGEQIDGEQIDDAQINDARFNEGIADAFADGWFSDPSANGQVALWGLLLAVIGVVSYLVSRKAKRDWVGLLVGVGPFVVTLYFFFQNANRLLPPNL